MTEKPAGRRGLKRMALGAAVAWTFVILGGVILTQPERVESPLAFAAFLTAAGAFAVMMTARTVMLARAPGQAKSAGRDPA